METENKKTNSNKEQSDVLKTNRLSFRHIHPFPGRLVIACSAKGKIVYGQGMEPGRGFLRETATEMAERKAMLME